MSEAANIKNLISKCTRRLQKLKEQQASFGLHTPPHILVEIEDTEAKLKELQAQLVAVETTGVPKDSLPDWPWRIIVPVVVVLGAAVLGIGGAIFLVVRRDEPNPPSQLLARVVRTDSEIHIDGSLDESAWSEGVSFIYAVHPARNDFTTATVRFLWDDDFLYAGFDVNDTQVEMADLSTLWDSDSVSLLLHDRGIAEHRQSLGEELNDDMAAQLKPMSTLNEPADTDTGYTVEMRIKWKDPASLGRRIPADLLSVDHDANPGAKYDAPGTIFSKLSWDGDGDITTAGASLLLVGGKHS
jgi:hypothetical protein